MFLNHLKLFGAGGHRGFQYFTPNHSRVLEGQAEEELGFPVGTGGTGSPVEAKQQALEIPGEDRPGLDGIQDSRPKFQAMVC